MTPPLRIKEQVDAGLAAISEVLAITGRLTVD